MSDRARRRPGDSGDAMLLLVFQAGGARYAVAARAVLEVIPRVAGRPCPGAPAYVAGLIAYRGMAVPVLDLCRMTAGVPCADRLSSRIVLVEHRRPDGRPRAVGLLAEAVCDTVERPDNAFSQPGLRVPGAPYLGTVALDGAETVQALRLEALLTPEAEALLETEPAGSAADVVPGSARDEARAEQGE